MAQSPRRRLRQAPEEVAEVEAAVVDRPMMRSTSTTDREPMHEEVHAEPRRRRRKKYAVLEDMFYIPVDEIPEGSSYEWKRFSNMGLEDPFYIAHMREQGWEPVDPKRHPTWLPPGYKEPHIIRGGLILMERPIELTREAEAETRHLARQQVREAEQRLGKAETGQMERVKPTLTKEIGRMVPAQTVEE